MDRISTPGRTRLLFALIVTLTLGLAPFFPEPHIWGKLRWVAGGATGMTLLDFGDLAWHAWPWFWLAVEGVLALRRRRSGPAV